MPRTPASVTQADIARAIRAMRAAGYPDVRVVFKDGVVIVEPVLRDSGMDQGAVPPADPDELDIL